MTFEEIDRKLDELERHTGKWVTGFTLTPEGITNVVYADIGPFDDYVINVWDCKAELCKQVGRMDFVSVEDKIPDELKDTCAEWLLDNIEAQGGAINRSGIYRVVLGMPAAVAEALGIVPEMEMWDEEGDIWEG